MTANELIQNIEALGGSLVLRGERIRYELPYEAAPFLEQLRLERNNVLRILRQRGAPPAMPEGVTLSRWMLKKAPIVLTRWSVVTDVHSFVSSTLAQLGEALRGGTWLAGNWSVQELVDRLRQVGVEVEIPSRGISNRHEIGGAGS